MGVPNKVSTTAPFSVTGYFEISDFLGCEQAIARAAMNRSFFILFDFWDLKIIKMQGDNQQFATRMF
jgi:hypothetical protein